MVSPTIIVLVLAQITAIFTAVSWDSDITVSHFTVPQLPRKCKIADAGCMKSVAQQMLPAFVAGIPELGIEPLDVMHIAKNKIDLSGLKLTVTNANIKGLKNAVIKHMSFDMGRKVLQLMYQADLGVKSQYKASGQLLVLPISGNGDMTIDLNNLHIDLTMPFDIVKNKDGKDILELKSYQFNYDVKGSAHFDFTNLFDGNKQLSTTLLSFMNENWKLLSVEFGRPMLEKSQKKIFEAIKTYLRSEPLENFVDK